MIDNPIAGRYYVAQTSPKRWGIIKCLMQPKSSSEDGLVAAWELITKGYRTPERAQRICDDWNGDTDA